MRRRKNALERYLAEERERKREDDMSTETTQTAHTPGPWEYDPCQQATPRGPWVAVDIYTRSGSEPDIVVTADDYDTAIANARLIAAAPDLLAACRAASRRIDELETDNHAPVAFCELRGIQETLDAAIAKAEGGE